MASRKTLNTRNLEALGAPRLAELIMEITTGDAAAKRRLRLELASTLGTSEIAGEVRKRLTTIGRSRSFVDWTRKDALVNDLETQHSAIVERITPSDPARGLELMWRFMALANSIFERCDDSSGRVGDIFYMALKDLGTIAESANPGPDQLADQTCEALTANDFGQYDGLVGVLQPALGNEGLARLKQHMIELSNTPAQRPPESEREVVASGPGGPLYADEIAERSRLRTVQITLQEIADAQGDVDAFIAQYDATTRKVPRIAADIARRLVAAGRVEEALATLDAAEHGRRSWPDFVWEDARIEALAAAGRHDDAQTARWSCFKYALSAPHLRAYLKQLEDDFDAEQAALDYALGYPGVLQALSFLNNWPDLDLAAKLIVERADELDGDVYEILTPAAEALAGRHPLAATLALRAMIDFTLDSARSSRYKHAARHLAECERLAGAINDFGSFETHTDYDTRIRQENQRKTSFIKLLA